MVDVDEISRYVDKGMEYANSRDYVKAIDNFEKALEISPEYCYGTSLIWGLMACAYADAGVPSIAIDCCKRGILADSTNGMNYRVLGDLYLRLDEPEKAARYINQGRMLSLR